jgi:hypothetical protein
MKKNTDFHYSHTEEWETTGRRKKIIYLEKEKCHKENGYGFGSYKLGDRSAQGRRARVLDIKKTEK